MFLFFTLASCSTLTQKFARRHWRSILDQIDRVFVECGEQQVGNKETHWIEVVRCGNDGARQVLADSKSPYAALVEAALTQRQEVAQQIDTGTITAEEGKMRLAEIDELIDKLPGSLTDLLSFSSVHASN